MTDLLWVVFAILLFRFSSLLRPRPTKFIEVEGHDLIRADVTLVPSKPRQRLRRPLSLPGMSSRPIFRRTSWVDFLRLPS